MKKGYSFVGEVKRVEFPNKGIIEIEDKKVIVKNTVPGQVLSCTINKKKKSTLEARVDEILKKSDLENNTDACKFFGTCGGCLYQSVSYENQLNIKEEQMKRLLSSIKDEFVWEGIAGSPLVDGYRNKMEFSFGDEYKDGPLALGMHKRGGYYDIVSTNECKIVHEDFCKVLELSLEFFKKKNISYYHKLRHSGLLRHLIVRRSFKTKELLIVLVTASNLIGGVDVSGSYYDKGISLKATKEVEDLVDEWCEFLLTMQKEGKFDGSIAGILHTVNDSFADAVINQGTKTLYGKDFIIENLNGLDFKISPYSFFQTNSKCAEILYENVGEYIGDTTDKAVFDLYSGTGTIAQLLAKYATKVYGVEIVKEAVEAAKENALLNGIKNCTFIAGDVLKVIDNLEDKPDIIVLDPPRDGINPKALPKILAYNASRIVYVSCKPTSFVRDYEIMREAGYRIKKAKAVDMFPSTGNVELVVLMDKSDISKN